MTRPDAPWPFVRTIVERVELDSTSNLARELVADPALVLPLLVRAQRQTAGRGRADRRWYSDSGSLTFTLALDPADLGLRPEHLPRVALASAVAIVEATAPMLSTSPGIRWPNDVEIANRKLAGILPELVDSPHGTRLLVGIGLNLTTSLDDAPPEVRRLATSLAREGARSLDLDPDAVLRLLLERLAHNLESLARGDPDLADRWRRLDTLLGRPFAVEQAGTITRGLGAGITPEGALLLADERGTRPILGGTILREHLASS